MIQCRFNCVLIETFHRGVLGKEQNEGVYIMYSSLVSPGKVLVLWLVGLLVAASTGLWGGVGERRRKTIWIEHLVAR